MNVTERVRPLLFAALTIAAGLLWRMAPLHLPAFALKYGGSALYAAMFYWLLKAAFPRWRPASLAAGAFALSASVECFKLVHTAALDRFRLSLAGRLTLGRFFSFGALLAYAVGAAAAQAADRYQRRRRRRLA